MAGTAAQDDTAESVRTRGAVARKARGARSFWWELPVLLVIALVIALLIKSFVVQAFYIPSSSMENTLNVGDKVLVNKLVYHFRPIEPGDIVVFNGAGSWDPVPSAASGSSDPLARLYDVTLGALYHSILGLFGTAPGQEDFIKRVIGVPGDRVACCNAGGDITVNGVPLREQSYLYPGNVPSATRFSITVPRGRLWVMGDHRAVSYDSRGHTMDPGDGTIPESMVIGRAFMIVWPPGRWRVLSVPATFGQPGVGGPRGAALGAAVAPATPYLPLEAGFVIAVPLTWLQRRLRRQGPRWLRSAAGRAAACGAGDAMPGSVQRLPGYTPRRDGGLSGYERILARAGLKPVAGIDEAGRGACAGPLVVAAVILNPRRTSALTGLADSKALTVSAREAAYEEVIASALAWHVVEFPPGDIDRLGLHVCNVTGMRRAMAGLACRPGYVLTDGFPVRGLAVPALAMWKGDEVAACVAAASIVAKVTRDQIMRGLHKAYPQYGFSRHKGYSTPSHMAALAEHGPCPQHRMSFANVIGVVRARAGLPVATGLELTAEEAAERVSAGPRPTAEAADGMAAQEAGELAGDGAGLSYG